MSSNAPAFADASPVSAPPSRIPAATARRPLDVHDPALSFKGERSWLELSARVLENARDAALPVLDRLRFLSIFSSKLDELFMVRVAGLKRQIARGVAETRADGLLPAEQLERIAARTRDLLEVQHAAWRDGILPALASAGMRIVAPADLSPEQREAARRRFVGSVFPALTPLAVDPGHPFPHLRNPSLSLAVSLQRGDGRRRRAAARLLAVVQVPPVLPRLVRLPSGSGEAYALLEEIIAQRVEDLFPGHAVVETTVFRVTRNWELDVDEQEDSQDLHSTLHVERRRRDRGAAVRLELSAGASRGLEAALVAALALELRDVYRIPIPLQVADLLALGGLRDDLR